MAIPASPHVVPGYVESGGMGAMVALLAMVSASVVWDFHALVALRAPQLRLPQHHGCFALMTWCLIPFASCTAWSLPMRTDVI